MADFVINTSGTMADTEREVHKVFESMKALAAEQAKAAL
jgi:hypothetical protein